MSTATASTGTTGQAQATGVYVYGIVPEDVETDPEAHGVGGESATVTVVRHGRIAALVTELDLDRPLGTPDDLLGHERLLDATAAVVPVLPARFGAVLADRQATVDELLAPNHDWFAAALRELEGKAEYVVRARYVEGAVLREVIESDPALERLRARIRDKPEETTRSERIALGEAINTAIDARRQADGGRVAQAIEPSAAGVIVRDAAGELDAANVAVLAETSREPELVQVVEGLARDWAGRVEVRLLGPLAPYDFVADLRPGE
ncbi:GvpL/GvpF family gas vesicle protein [Dactylosporangium cerinum]|uniref:GvpL/GvpF family gas vesicle protein n=1 Tax=Dactylosporangium cerinum TaxID=1434730 RepID=A0ABV9WB23_9ACTN